MMEPFYQEIQQALQQQSGKSVEEADFSEIIELTQRQLTVYEQQGKVGQQIDTLLRLAGVLLHAGEKEQAATCLEKVENLLLTATVEDVPKVWMFLRPGKEEEFLALRRAEAERLKQYVIS